MNKKELIRKISKESGILQRDCATVLDALLKITSDELAAGGEINLSGFGALRIRTRTPRRGINPRTGEEMEIPAGKSVVFKAGAPLQARIDENDDTARIE